MNYQLFINQQVINKNNVTGVAISIDEEHVTIKYDSEEKTYNTNIAFKNGFLKFVKDEYNQLMSGDISSKDEIELNKQKEVENNHEHYVKITKEANEEFKVLSAKNSVMKKLFGSDFKYPPYEEFVKKYKHVLKKYYRDFIYGTSYVKYL